MVRPVPVTYCRPEPPCVVTDIPKLVSRLPEFMKRFEKILPNLRVMALVKEGCIPYGQAYGFITLTFSKQAFNESLDFFLQPFIAS